MVISTVSLMLFTVTLRYVFAKPVSYFLFALRHFVFVSVYFVEKSTLLQLVTLH